MYIKFFMMHIVDMCIVSVVYSTSNNISILKPK